MEGLNEIESRFLEHCIAYSHGSVSGPNSEADALLYAIQGAYDGSNMGKGVAVTPYFVHNLASSLRVALYYGPDERIPWDTSDHDYVIKRTLRGFMKSIAAAVQMGLVIEGSERGLCIHAFPIPTWLEKWAWEVRF